MATETINSTFSWKRYSSETVVHSEKFSPSNFTRQGEIARGIVLELQRVEKRGDSLYLFDLLCVVGELSRRARSNSSIPFQSFAE